MIMSPPAIVATEIHGNETDLDSGMEEPEGAQCDLPTVMIAIDCYQYARLIRGVDEMQ